MRAVGFYEYGPAHVLQVLDLPELNAGQGEVRVKDQLGKIFHILRKDIVLL